MLFFAPKNPTPRQLAVITALDATVNVTFVLVVMKVFAPDSINWLSIGVVAVISFITGCYSLYRALKYFIYRKIKLIYKTIHSIKAPKESSPISIDMKTHLIDRVEKEVVEWAQDWTREISALKSMEEYRREFIGNVSHELKTPIFNMQGYLDTLIDGGIHDDAINEKYLKRAAYNAERMANIVADLGYISKFEAGKLQLDILALDIRQLIKEVIDDMEFKALKKDIKLMFKEDTLKNAFVFADKESIRRVIVNLISNSIKYGKDSGKTLVGLYDMGDNILVEISDNGKGIEQEHLPRLFERFYRVDKDRSRSAGGTGLGLAIVKHILEAHQQSVNVRSRIEMGSTFGFTLKKV